jgi:hypothetical protein
LAFRPLAHFFFGAGFGAFVGRGADGALLAGCAVWDAFLSTMKHYFNALEYGKVAQQTVVDPDYLRVPWQLL